MKPRQVSGKNYTPRSRGRSVGGKLGLNVVFNAIATFIADIRQTNNIGAALSATATITADIFSSATKQVGAAFSATIAVTADVAQGTPSAQPLAMDMSNFSNTYILQL